MLPRKMKNFNVFVDGNNWIGVCNEIELPKLSKKLEDFQTGNGVIELDMGNEKLETTLTLEGFEDLMLASFGSRDVSGLALRFSGAHEIQDATGSMTKVELIMRGRVTEIDSGTPKKGEGHQYKAKISLTYYKVIVDDVDLLEIDHVNFIEIVNGDDRLAQERSAIGL